MLDNLKKKQYNKVCLLYCHNIFIIIFEGTEK